MVEGSPAELEVSESTAVTTRTAAPRSSRFGVVRHIPGLVWAITALWLALLLGASVVWPMGYGYDEAHHIDMAYDYAYHPFKFYGPGQLNVTYADVGMQHLLPGVPPSKSFANVPIAPRSQRPSFLALGGPKLTSGGQPNQMDQHPPLYYWLEAAVLRLPGVSHLAWDLQVWLMRVLSVIMVAPLPILSWATARRLMTPEGAVPVEGGVTEWLAVLAAVLPLTCASLVRDGAAVTNDTLLVALTSLLIYLMARVLRGDRSVRTAILVAATVATALWTKGTALVFPPFVVLAYLIANPARGIVTKIRTVAFHLVVVIGGCVVGGLWWLRNLIDYGTVQPSGLGASYESVVYGAPDHTGTIVHWGPIFVVQYVSRMWGGVGILDTPSIGPFVEYGWPAVLGLAVMASLVSKGHPGDRRRAWLIFVIAVAISLVVADGSFSTNRNWSMVIAGAQGRYLYPCFTALFALAVWGIRRVLRPRSTIWLPLLVLIAALLTNAATWLIILRSWYKPSGASSTTLGGVHQAFSSLLRWSPLPDGLTVLFVVVFPLIAGVVVVAQLATISWRASR